MNTQLDKILLGFIGSSSLVGVYHMGQTFAMTIFQFMTGLDRVFQPELYRKLFADKYANNSHEINDYILPFFYVSIFMALMVILFANEFILLFLSEEYQEATIIIIILSIYYASLFFGKVTGNQLIYAKKTHITTLLTFLGIVINVGLNIPFIIKWGIVGAAWATTISGVVVAVMSYIVAQRYVKITWKWKPIFTIYGLFLMAALFSLIDYGSPMHLYISLMLKITFIFIYIVIGHVSDVVSISKIKELFSIRV
jgi:O-antigen/teichoic acid export membrane protein